MKEDETMINLYTAQYVLPGFNAATKFYFADAESRKAFVKANPGAKSGRKPEMAHRDNVERTRMNIAFYGLNAQ